MSDQLYPYILYMPSEIQVLKFKLNLILLRRIGMYYYLRRKKRKKRKKKRKKK